MYFYKHVFDILGRIPLPSASFFINNGKKKAIFLCGKTVRRLDVGSLSSMVGRIIKGLLKKNVLKLS